MYNDPTIRSSRQKTNTPRALAGSIAFLVAGFLIPPSADASTYYWDVNGTGAGSGFSTVAGTWATGNQFWNTDSSGGNAGATVDLPTSADNLNISAGTTGTITIGATGTASSLTISDNVPVMIAGGTLALGGTGGQSGLFVTATDNAATAVASALTLNVGSVTLQNAGTGVLTLSGGVTGAQPLILKNNNTTDNGITLSTTAVNNSGSNGIIQNLGTGSGSVLISAPVGPSVVSIYESSGTSALNVTGALTVNSTGTALLRNVNGGSSVLTLSGGVSGTGSLNLFNVFSTANGITVSGAPVNNTGAINNAGGGTGSVLISAPVGSAVTGINQNSANSPLSVTGRLTVGSTTTLVNAIASVGGASFTLSGGVDGTGALVLKNNSATAGGITLSTTAVNNAGTITNAGTSTGSVLISAAIGANVTGVTQNSASSGLILSGANTYAGNTTIHAGTLKLDLSGSISSSANIIVGDAGSSGTHLDVTTKTGGFTIGSGQTLKGIGQIDGNTTIVGTHSPGNSPGLQSFNGNLAYSSGSMLKWEMTSNVATDTGGVRGAFFDALDVLSPGHLSIATGVTASLIFNSAGSTVNFSNAFWASNHNWLVYDDATLPTLSSGSIFDTVTASTDSLGATLTAGTFSWAEVGNNVVLNYLVGPVPEPASIGALTALGLLGIGTLRRRRQT
jgi:hypothetical protein